MTDRRTFLLVSTTLLAAGFASPAAAIGFVTGVHKVDEVVVGSAPGSTVVVLSRTPRLKWTAIPGAVSYVVAVADPARKTQVWRGTTNLPEIAVGAPLAWGNTYAATVAGVDKSGKVAGSVLVQNFRPTDPAKPK